MWKRILMSLPVAATLSAAGGPIPVGMNQFAAATYAKLAPADGNIIFSSFNSSTALAMAWAGARGRPASDMAAGLQQADDPASHPTLAALVKQLTGVANTAGDELVMANGLWVAKGLPILPAFAETMRGPYGAPLTPLDFTA